MYIHTNTFIPRYSRNGWSANFCIVILNFMPSWKLANSDQAERVMGVTGILSIKIVHVGSYTVQFNIKCNSAKELGSHFNIYKEQISRTRLYQIGCVQQLWLIKQTSNLYLVSIKKTRVGFRYLYNQGNTQGINKLGEKKIHILYIKKNYRSHKCLWRQKK